jgi:hypothetical protein
MISPTTPYTGAYAVPANYRATTPNVDFGFGVLGSSGPGSSGGSGSEEGSEEGSGSGGESGSGDSSGEDSDSDSGDSGSSGGSGTGGGSTVSPGGDSESGTEQSGRNYPRDKLLLETAQDAIQKAQALKSKVYSALEQADSIPDETEDLLTQADSCLEKALEFYSKGNFLDALQWAEKAIQYYQEILELLT